MLRGRQHQQAAAGGGQPRKRTLAVAGPPDGSLQVGESGLLYLPAGRAGRDRAGQEGRRRAGLCQGEATASQQGAAQHGWGPLQTCPACQPSPPATPPAQRASPAAHGIGRGVAPHPQPRASLKFLHGAGPLLLLLLLAWARPRRRRPRPAAAASQPVLQAAAGPLVAPRATAVGGGRCSRRWRCSCGGTQGWELLQAGQAGSGCHQMPLQACCCRKMVQVLAPAQQRPPKTRPASPPPPLDQGPSWARAAGCAHTDRSCRQVGGRQHGGSRCVAHNTRRVAVDHTQSIGLSWSPFADQHRQQAAAHNWPHLPASSAAYASAGSSAGTPAAS